MGGDSKKRIYAPRISLFHLHVYTRYYSRCLRRGLGTRQSTDTSWPEVFHFEKHGVKVGGARWSFIGYNNGAGNLAQVTAFTCFILLACPVFKSERFSKSVGVDVLMGISRYSTVDY